MPNIFVSLQPACALAARLWRKPKSFRWALALAYLLLSAHQVFARIGETETEIEARYGKPEVMRPQDDGTRVAYYRLGNFYVLVHFFEGHSHCEQFGKNGDVSQKDLSEREMSAFLEANSFGSRWVEVNTGDLLRRRWSWSGGKMIAFYDTMDFVSPMLTIMTRQFDKKIQAEKERREKENLGHL